MLAFVYLTDQSKSDQYLREVVERWFRMFAATSILNICCYLQTVSFISRLFVVESLDVCRKNADKTNCTELKSRPQKGQCSAKIPPKTNASTLNTAI